MTAAALASVRYHATSDRREYSMGDCCDCAAELGDRALARCLDDPQAVPLCELCRLAGVAADEGKELSKHGD